MAQEAQGLAARASPGWAADQPSEGSGAGEGNAPGSSAAHSKPASLGWGRLKKVKLAAQTEGSQGMGTKRRRSGTEGAQLLSIG